MFREIKNKYESSLREKQDKLEYWKGTHSCLMEIRDLNLLMKESNVERLVVEKDGAYVELNSGIKLYLSEKDYAQIPVTCLCAGDYETEETDMVIKILDYYSEDKGFTVLDIGANVGWYSLNILNRYPSMRVFSVEPSPVTFDRLKRNFRLNDMDDGNLVNLGFYKEKEKLDFYYNEEESGASSLTNLRGSESVKKECVEMVRIDDWTAENKIDRIDFIKCDVEGAEFFVYQGGVETIQKCRPIIFSEMLRKWSAKFDYHPNDIIAFLGGVGYECFVISGDGLDRIDTVTEATVETNYFFLHKEKHNKIISELWKKN